MLKPSLELSASPESTPTNVLAMSAEEEAEMKFDEPIHTRSESLRVVGASESMPAESNVLVAVPPKYAFSKTERRVVEAPAEKSWSPVQEFWLASKVEEAAEMVMEPPAFKVVPFTVPSEPERMLVPIEVVEMSCLFWSSAKSVEAVCPVSQADPAEKSVEVAFAKVLRPLHEFWSDSAVDEAAVIVMFEVPSKLVPLMVRPVWSAVAVEAFPVTLPVREPMKLVNHAVVPESSVEVAFAKVLSPLHEFWLASKVEEAA